ncbi:MAG TPA: hypothetical protein PKE30_16750 [Niabella sp.]|nr:hypothetical protein [Niabella sp.]
MIQDEETQQEPVFNNDPLDGSEGALLQISKWTRQIAVIGFAIGSFIVIVMLFSGAQILKTIAAALPVTFPGMYPVLVVSFFILFFLAALVLFYLYKASQLLFQGVQQKDSALLSQAFVYIKNFFIVVIVFAALQLVVNLSNLLS